MIRLGAFGDVVRTFPAVAALRALYPDATLSWLVEPASADAVARQPSVDEVIVFPRRELAAALGSLRLRDLWHRCRTHVASLRSRRFDLVVDFHGILKSGVLAWSTGAPLRVGYARPFGRELAWLLVNRRADLGRERISRYARNAALVGFLGGDVRKTQSGVLRWRASGDTRTTASDDVLATVVLHPGTSPGTPHKRYPVSSHAAVARALHARGLRCLVASGPDPDERALAEAVVAAAGGAATLAPATKDFDGLAALLAGCALFIGSDTGPLHVASLVGTPVVQLMGPTDPIENEPWPGTPWRRVRVPLACSPCRRGCATAPCMQRLRPAAVVEAAVELLASAGRIGAAS